MTYTYTQADNDYFKSAVEHANQTAKADFIELLQGGKIRDLISRLESGDETIYRDLMKLLLTVDFLSDELVACAREERS